MKPPGRNEACTCGSKQKYKHCCGRLEQNRSARILAAIASKTLREKNVALLAAAADIFQVGKPWETIKRRITGAQVKEFYEFVHRLWPKTTDVLSLLPEPDSTLRALYLGEYAPEVITRNVCRFGLYADEIILINPFLNPGRIREEHNPLIHPEEWIEDTLRVVYQLVAMAPWVDKGFVTFIPNPSDFDFELFRETAKSAEERLQKTPITAADVEESTFVSYSRQKLMSCPNDYLDRVYRELFPNSTDEERLRFLKDTETQRNENPFLTGETMDNMPPQYVAARTGANLETGLYICQAIGAFPYTNMRYRWNEILSARDHLDATSEVWTPLTKAFQGLDFKFLDNVDVQFAYRMRDEERLGSFRTYLRKVWKAVNGSPAPTDSDRLARDFRDELDQSYHEAEKDWSEIDIDLMKWLGGGGLGAGIAAGAQTAFSGGKLQLEAPACGFALASVLQLVQSRIKRRNFRKTTPMSVFIDLSRKAQSS